MLCNLYYLCGIFYADLPIFHKPSNCSGQHSIVSTQPKGWYRQLYLSFSITLWMCRERTISRVGILLSEGGAEAVRMPQIRRRRPTGLSVGVNLYLSQKLVSELIVGWEDFIYNFTPFHFIVAIDNPPLLNISILKQTDSHDPGCRLFPEQIVAQVFATRGGWTVLES